MKNKISLFWLLCLLLLIASPAESQKSFSGIFKEGNKKTYYWNNASWENFTDKHKELRAKGYQLVDFEGRHVAKGKFGRFWGIWRETSIDSRIISKGGWEDFEQVVADQKRQGYALDDVESIINRNGNRIYIGLFCKGAKTQRIHKFRSIAALKDKTNNLKGQQLYLSDVDPFRTNDGNYQYLAVYTQSGASSTVLSVKDDWDAFNSDRLSKRRSGLGIIDYERFQLDGKTHHMAVFKRTPIKDSFWSNLEWNSFKAHRQHLRKQRNMRLMDIEIHDGTGKVSAPPTYVEKFKLTPDMWQHMPKIEEYRTANQTQTRKLDPDLEFNSNSFCGPTAVSNGIMYWAKEGNRPELNPKNSQIEMVKVLGNEDHMNALDSGTNFNKMTLSIEAYLKNNGNYILKSASLEHIGKPSGRNSMKNLPYFDLKEEMSSIDVERLQENLIDPDKMVILLWGNYEKKNGDLVRTGGHFVTVVGYGVEENGNSKEDMIVFHNPATSDKKPKQQYFEMKNLVGIDGITNNMDIKSVKKDGTVKWSNKCEGKILLRKKNTTTYTVLDAFAVFEIK